MSGWTDYCPDWSSKDKLRLCSVHDATTALCLALRERMNPTVRVGYNVGNPIKLTPVRNFFLNTPIYGGTQTESFDYLLRSTAEQYANHTINDGDFTAYMNSNNRIPRWTWDTLLGGEADAVTARNFEIIDYVYQRYKMINRLRWVYTTQRPSYSVPTLSGWAEATTIPAACDAAAAAAVSGSNTTQAGYSLFSCGETSNGYSCTASKRSNIMSIFNYSDAQYNDMTASVDIYLKTTAPSNNPDLFDGADLFVLNQWNRLQFNEMALPATIDLDLPWPSTYPPGGGIWTKGFYIVGDGLRGPTVYGVLKLDGFNGFQFRNW